jgi:hypothetical protein
VPYWTRPSCWHGWYSHSSLATSDATRRYYLLDTPIMLARLVLTLLPRYLGRHSQVLLTGHAHLGTSGASWTLWYIHQVIGAYIPPLGHDHAHLGHAWTPPIMLEPQTLVPLGHPQVSTGIRCLFRYTLSWTYPMASSFRVRLSSPIFPRFFGIVCGGILAATT